jgi:hypothetical protein
LQQRESLENGGIITGDVNEKVVVIEGLELDLDVGRLHNLVDLAILFAADELAMLIGKLDLKASLVMKGLDGLGQAGKIVGETHTP